MPEKTSYKERCWNGRQWERGAGWLLLVVLAGLGVRARGEETVIFDPLTCMEPVAGMESKASVGGEFTELGWISRSAAGMLKIALEGEGSKEGELEVDLTSDDWSWASRSSGLNRKLHFINMFSNGLGDHHAEDGGGEDDALWTLRHGSSADGSSRYGNGFKVLWASNGAKRSPGSDYHEKTAILPEGTAWQGTLTFRVQWSAGGRFLRIHVNGVQVADLPWQDQQSPLRYIFLGRAGDFHSLQGVYFSNLRVTLASP